MFVLVICPFFALCAQASTPLPAEQAFVFSAQLLSPSQLIVQWQIAPGYYLYRDKLLITAIPATVAKLRHIQWPKAKTLHLKTSETASAAHQVLQGNSQVLIPLNSGQQVELRLSYQGCSQEGFCYPALQKTVQVTYPFTTTNLKPLPLLAILAKQPVAVDSFLHEQSASYDFMNTHQWMISVLCFLGLGLLLAFTPCTLPMIPIISSLILGQRQRSPARGFYLSLSYVLGSALTYALAGVVVAELGASIQAYFQQTWIILLFSSVFIFLAVAMFGVFDLTLPQAWQQKIRDWSQQRVGGYYSSVFLMGCLSALIVAPCLTAPLLGVLTYVSTSGNGLLGGITLFALGLGMGLPLLLVGFSAGKYLPRSGPWMLVINQLLAFLLLGFVLWLWSRVLPSGLILFLSACLLLLIAVYTFFWLETATKVAQAIFYMVGAGCSLYAVVLFIGLALGQTSVFFPLVRTQPATVAFIAVNSQAQLAQVFAAAKDQHKAVILDFYAAWCESCRLIEKNVLNQPAVQKKLQSFVLIRADVTDNNAFDRWLLQQYQVIAPPTFLFFDCDGKEIVNKRLVGEISPQLLMTRL